MAMMAWILGIGIAWSVVALGVAVLIGGAIVRTRPTFQGQPPRRTRSRHAPLRAPSCQRVDRAAGQGRL